MKSVLLLLFAFSIIAGCGGHDLPAPTETEDPDVEEIVNACCPCNPEAGMKIENTAEIPDSMMMEYYRLWKEEFLRRNFISEEYFNEHFTDITIESKEITASNQGTSFAVVYTYTSNWYCGHWADIFLIRLNSNSTVYQTYDVPRDKLFSRDEVLRSMSLGILPGDIHTLVGIKSLKFQSYDDAVGAFRERSGSSDLEILGTVFAIRVYGKDEVVPAFYGTGSLDEGDNRCINSYFNLSTGELLRPNEKECDPD